MNVSWTPGFDGNSPVIKYILAYRYVPQRGPIPKEDLNWITALANISASSRSALLSNLRCLQYSTKLVFWISLLPASSVQYV